MKLQRRKVESGQVIVMLAFGIVALIGMTALAIDGGMVYAERRHAQNAADAAALAGALQNAYTNGIAGNQTLVINQALARALSNGYTNDGTHSIVTVTYPYNGSNYQVKVEIRSKVETALIQIVYSGEVWNTVSAVARIRPPQPIMPGQALVGLNKHACPTLDFDGHQATKISGGSVFSNSDANTNPSCMAAIQNGSGEVTVTGGEVESVGGFRQVGSGAVSPPPVSGAEQVKLPRIVPPACAGSAEPDPDLKPSDTKTIEPGRYAAVTSKGDLTLKPGFYCLDGAFSTNGGKIKVEGTLGVTDGVMIYSKSGVIDIGGNPDVILWAPRKEQLKLTGIDGQTYDYAGMLFFMDDANSSSVVMTGNANSQYQGTVFAPKGDCDIGGTSGTISFVSTQFICNIVKTHGNAILDIKYDEGKLYHLPFAIDVLH